MQKACCRRSSAGDCARRRVATVDDNTAFPGHMVTLWQSFFSLVATQTERAARMVYQPMAIIPAASPAAISIVEAFSTR
jgi:hypothetical protein